MIRDFINLDEAEIQSVSCSEDDEAPEWALKTLKQRKKINIDFYLLRQAKNRENDMENLCSQ